MGQFNKLLDATYHPPRKWVLNSSLSYDCDELTEEDIEILKSVGVKVTKKGKVTVPKGFVTDMASVPRICWAFIAPFDVARAAVIHDLLYKNIRQYRWTWREDDIREPKLELEIIFRAKEISDKIFLCAMNDSEPEVPSYKKNPAYWAVKVFGNSSIIPTKDNI
tara:strand:+ start:2571 stop:3062 length:492 start_codon:yes stop_codon:yes gene_type:complete